MSGSGDEIGRLTNISMSGSGLWLSADGELGVPIVPEFTDGVLRGGSNRVAGVYPWQPISKIATGLSLPLAEAFLLSREQLRASLGEHHVRP